jgi:nucleoside-diphosphate-sugar epimerase
VSDESYGVLVVGFPGALARAVATAISQSSAASIRLMAAADDVQKAHALTRTLGPRSRVVEGDPSRIDFGMAGPAYLDLAEETSVILCLIQPPPPGSSAKYERARAAAREVLELARAAPGLEHLVVLSHLDVAGTFSGTFAERDLEVGQGFPGVDQEERFRAERIYRRFVDDLPITIVRSGWIVGPGDGNCPLVQLLLSIADDPGKEGDRMVTLTGAGALARAISGLHGLPPSRGGRTLHLASWDGKTARELSRAARALASDLVPAGFDLIAGARRQLKRDGWDHQWSYREFFRRQPSKARFERAWSDKFLEQQGLPRSDSSEALLGELVEGAVEEIVGFK